VRKPITALSWLYDEEHVILGILSPVSGYPISAHADAQNPAPHIVGSHTLRRHILSPRTIHAQAFGAILRRTGRIRYQGAGVMRPAFLLSAAHAGNMSDSGPLM
jgi:hypothetical protein